MPQGTFRCQQCGIEFTDKYRKKRRQFCSVSCRQSYLNHPSRNPAKRPEVRAKISATSKGHKRCVGRILSPKIRQKISEANTGKKRSLDSIKKGSETLKRNRILRGSPTPAQQRYYKQSRPGGSHHWNWKDGISKQRDKEYKSSEYLAFRKAVLVRDDYTCQGCGIRNGFGKNVRLEVHHIKSYGEHPELRFDVNNGITLCRSCHNKTKKGKPRQKRVDFKPTPRICEHCGKEYAIRNPRKYCLKCRNKICCPVCGSTKCNHSARKNMLNP